MKTNTLWLAETPRAKARWWGTTGLFLHEKGGREAERVDSEGRGVCRGQQETNQVGPLGATGFLWRALRSGSNFEQGSDMVQLS